METWNPNHYRLELRAGPDEIGPEQQQAFFATEEISPKGY